MPITSTRDDSIESCRSVKGSRINLLSGAVVYRQEFVILRIKCGTGRYFAGCRCGAMSWALEEKCGRGDESLLKCT